MVGLSEKSLLSLCVLICLEGKVFAKRNIFENLKLFLCDRRTWKQSHVNVWVSVVTKDTDLFHMIWHLKMHHFPASFVTMSTCDTVHFVQVPDCDWKVLAPTHWLQARKLRFCSSLTFWKVCPFGAFCTCVECHFESSCWNFTCAGELCSTCKLFDWYKKCVCAIGAHLDLHQRPECTTVQSNLRARFCSCLSTCKLFTFAQSQLQARQLGCHPSIVFLSESTCDILFAGKNQTFDFWNHFQSVSWTNFSLLVNFCIRFDHFSRNVEQNKKHLNQGSPAK